MWNRIGDLMCMYFRRSVSLTNQTFEKCNATVVPGLSRWAEMLKSDGPIQSHVCIGANLKVYMFQVYT